MIHIELIKKKKKIKATRLKNISISCRNIKSTFSAMSHTIFSTRIHVMDAFLDLMLGEKMVISTNDFS